MSRRLGLLALAVVLAGWAEPASAQQQDTALTREQRIRERLRSLSPLIRPDTVAADSTVAADTADSRPEVSFEPDAAGREVVAGVSAVSRDSLMQALMRLSGYVSTEYKGDTATYAADSSRLVLLGAAEVVRDGQHITADTSLIYYDKLAYACAYGSPVVSGGSADSPVQSDSLCYDVEHDVGVALGASTEVSEGAVWYVTGDLVTVGERVYSHSAIFTDCALEEPHYHFGAGQMKVLKNNVMVARNVTLKFGDVPVFWLPFFMQSLSQGRRSGLLFPRFGINDIARNSSRYSRSIEDVGFYWAISDHLGAVAALDWKSDNFTSLRGSFDYRFIDKFLSGGLTFRQYWPEAGPKTFTVAAQNSWQPDERTGLTSSINYARSSQFIAERATDPRELNQSIASAANLNRRFDWGSMSLGGSRNQDISTGLVRMTLPSVNLTLSPLTLFPALPGESKWYNNVTWSGGGQATRRTTGIEEALARPSQQSDRELSGNVRSSFSMGRFSWAQGFDMRERIVDARGFDNDTTADLPGREERTGNWSTSFSYQQPLIATTSLTPSLSLSGQLARDSLDGSMVSGPTRMNFGASLNTALFGFYPGFGPFEAVRHRLSPTFSYSYSPAPTVTDLQRRVFGVTEVSEQNGVTIGVSQTFEAKFKAGREPTRTGPVVPQSRADSLALLPDDSLAMLPDSLRALADSARAANPDLLEPPDTTRGPRRRETGQKIMLLSISTSSFVYDFVRAREDGQGLRTQSVTNNLQSELLPGFQLTLTHDLFRTVQPDDPGSPLFPNLPGSGLSMVRPRPSREFAPHLSGVNANFSINSDSWIARLFRRSSDGEAADSTSPGPEDELGDEEEFDLVRGGDQRLIGGRREVEQAPMTPVGTWNASFTYSLSRPRVLQGPSLESQMITANLRFQPTVNWSVSWNTGYSLTQREFSSHVLTLSRRLHDFDANFDFYKAQNGNFSFQFRVQLRANPDMKFDYEQRDLPALDSRFR